VVAAFARNRSMARSDGVDEVVKVALPRLAAELSAWIIM
jgi:hypothetical protein